jgi:hypothetical protein
MSLCNRVSDSEGKSISSWYHGYFFGEHVLDPILLKITDINCQYPVNL